MSLTTALTVVGFGVGLPFASAWSYAPWVGAWAGGTIGATIEAATRSKDRARGPLIETIRTQVSTYGVPINRAYGSVRVAGNVIWAGEPKLVVVQDPVLGAFGVDAEADPPTIEQRFIQDFAIGFCKGPIDGVPRVWIADKLVSDWRIPATITETTTIPRIVNQLFTMHLYLGDETQVPNAFMDFFESGGDQPAYRGLVYALFTGFDLSKYGNRIPKIEIETAQHLATITDAFGTVFPASAPTVLLEDGTPQQVEPTIRPWNGEMYYSDLISIHPNGKDIIIALPDVSGVIDGSMFGGGWLRYDIETLERRATAYYPFYTIGEASYGSLTQWCDFDIDEDGNIYTGQAVNSIHSEDLTDPRTGYTVKLDGLDFSILETGGTFALVRNYRVCKNKAIPFLAGIAGISWGFDTTPPYSVNGNGIVGTQWNIGPGGDDDPIRDQILIYTRSDVAHINTIYNTASEIVAMIPSGTDALRFYSIAWDHGTGVLWAVMGAGCYDVFGSGPNTGPGDTILLRIRNPQSSSDIEITAWNLVGIESGRFLAYDSPNRQIVVGTEFGGAGLNEYEIWAYDEDTLELRGNLLNLGPQFFGYTYAQGNAPGSPWKSGVHGGFMYFIHLNGTTSRVDLTSFEVREYYHFTDQDPPLTLGNGVFPYVYLPSRNAIFTGGPFGVWRIARLDLQTGVPPTIESIVSDIATSCNIPDTRFSFSVTVLVRNTAQPAPYSTINDPDFPGATDHCRSLFAGSTTSFTWAIAANSYEQGWRVGGDFPTAFGIPATSYWPGGIYKIKLFPNFSFQTVDVRIRRVVFYRVDRATAEIKAKFSSELLDLPHIQPPPGDGNVPYIITVAWVDGTQNPVNAEADDFIGMMILVENVSGTSKNIRFTISPGIEIQFVGLGIEATNLTEPVRGYLVNSIMTGRDAIQPLMDAFFFDGVETEGKLKFPYRGGAPVTIPGVPATILIGPAAFYLESTPESGFGSLTPPIGGDIIDGKFRLSNGPSGSGSSSWTVSSFYTNGNKTETRVHIYPIPLGVVDWPAGTYTIRINILVPSISNPDEVYFQEIKLLRLRANGQIRASSSSGFFDNYDISNPGMKSLEMVFGGVNPSGRLATDVFAIAFNVINLGAGSVSFSYETGAIVGSRQDTPLKRDTGIPLASLTPAPKANLGASLDGATLLERYVSTIQGYQEVPRAVEVICPDPDAEYRIQTQREERADFVVGSEIATARIPVVLSVDEAKQVAVKSLGILWEERTKSAIDIPRPYGVVDPCDVLEIVEDGVTHRVRVDRIERKGGIVSAQVTDEDVGLYTSDALGVPLPPGPG